MKLKKIVKHLDSFADTYLYNEYGHCVWSGKMLDLQVAADVHGDKQIYLNECKADGDFEAIEKCLSAQKFLNWKLYTDEGGEAISFCHKKNEHGVDIPILAIDLTNAD